MIIDNRKNERLFYFVPADFTCPSKPEEINVATGQGIDARYLTKMFDISKIKSHKLMLILDSCHSGSVILGMRGLERQEVTLNVMEKMAMGTGRFIFASSSGDEVSREHDQIKHGLYTYVFLNALKEGDADNDGELTLTDIRNYIEKNFDKQTKPFRTKDDEEIAQSPIYESLGRTTRDERRNDFPLLKLK